MKLGIYAWTVLKLNTKYYLPKTHNIYLKGFYDKFQEVTLFAPIKVNNAISADLWEEIDSNINVVELGEISGFSDGYKLIFSLFQTRRTRVDYWYVRYPFPFAWILMLGNKGSLHLVGDSIEVLRNSDGKMLKAKILLLKIDRFLIRNCSVGFKRIFNGKHLQLSYGFNDNNSFSITSSLLSLEDFTSRLSWPVVTGGLRFLYVGYLRKTKHVDEILSALSSLKLSEYKVTLDIVGDGPERNNLERLASELKIEVRFHGHIESRARLKYFYDNSDVYLFASSSEGSPRSVLEAIAGGCVIISKPVGSLPYDFNDQTILFSENLSSESFKTALCSFFDAGLNNQEVLIRISKAQSQAKEFTFTKMLNRIFE